MGNSSSKKQHANTNNGNNQRKWDSAPSSAWIIRFTSPLSRTNTLHDSHGTADPQGTTDPHGTADPHGTSGHGRGIFHWPCPDWIEGTLFRELSIVIVQTFLENDRDKLSTIITHPQSAVEMLAQFQDFRSVVDTNELSELEQELLSADHYCIDLSIESGCLTNLDLLITDSFDPGYVLRNTLHLQSRVRGYPPSHSEEADQASPPIPEKCSLPTPGRYSPLIPTAPLPPDEHKTKEEVQCLPRPPSWYGIGVEDGQDQLISTSEPDHHYGSSGNNDVSNSVASHETLKRHNSVNSDSNERCSKIKRLTSSYEDVYSNQTPRRVGSASSSKSSGDPSSSEQSGEHCYDLPSPHTTSVPLSHPPHWLQQSPATSQTLPEQRLHDHFHEPSRSVNLPTRPSYTSTVTAPVVDTTPNIRRETSYVSSLDSLAASDLPHSPPPSPHQTNIHGNAMKPVEATNMGLQSPPTTLQVTMANTPPTSPEMPRSLPHYPVPTTSTDPDITGAAPTLENSVQGRLGTESFTSAGKVTIKREREDVDTCGKCCHHNNEGNQHLTEERTEEQSNGKDNTRLYDDDNDDDDNDDGNDDDDDDDDGNDDDNDDDENKGNSNNDNDKHDDSNNDDSNDDSDDNIRKDDADTMDKDSEDRQSTNTTSVSVSPTPKAILRNPFLHFPIHGFSRASLRSPPGASSSTTDCGSASDGIKDKSLERKRPRVLPIHGLTRRQYKTNPDLDHQSGLRRPSVHDNAERNSSKRKRIEDEEESNSDHSLSEWDDAADEIKSCSPENQEWHDATDKIETSERDSMENDEWHDAPEIPHETPLVGEPSADSRLQATAIVIGTCRDISQAICVVTLIAMLTLSPR